jgi:hypothetical protein
MKRWREQAQKKVEAELTEVQHNVVASLGDLNKDIG